jgi:hypothetical protein
MIPVGRSTAYAPHVPTYIDVPGVRLGRPSHMRSVEL